jgi:hypothetical protein
MVTAVVCSRMVRANEFIRPRCGRSLCREPANGAKAACILKFMTSTKTIFGEPDRDRITFHAMEPLKPYVTDG